jgi:HD-GYP domain-containing protein (c-di-GMP phosphodiesterase class II)
VNPEQVQSLVSAIERKDALTAAHTWRVVLYSRALAEARGVDHATIARITQAAALHDVGKLDIPDAILQKPGKLTDEEFEVIKTHPALGHARLLALGETDDIILSLVRHHHERLDGLGYPDGLKGKAILLGPSLFSVIDSFDALTSIRPYRQDVGEAAAERAMEELYAAAGTRYCPEAVRAFDRLFRSGQLGWILEHFNDRCHVHPFSAGEIVGTLAHPLRTPR